MLDHIAINIWLQSLYESFIILLKMLVFHCAYLK